jgi:hypothetical protein
MLPWTSKTMQRLDVVPWSIAATYRLSVVVSLTRE